MVDVIQQEEPYDLTVWQGKSFELQVRFTETDETPIPLDGYTARGQIRQYANGPLLATFNTEVIPEEGVINVGLDGSQTSKVRDRSVYDLQIESGPTKIGILFGSVHAIRGVTQ